MNSLKLYTFNRPVPAERFDCCFRYFLIQELEKKYKVEWFNLSGDDNFIYENEGDTYKFYDGSTALIEMENKKIKLLDFGDCPISTLNISKFKNFQMSAIAHYNPKLWNNDTRMKSGILYETNWEFGKTNSNEVVEFRKNIELNNKLYWLGTIYKNTGIDRYDGCRDSIPLISKFLRDKFSFNPRNFFTKVIEK